MEKILIAKILKPKGLKGQLKVNYLGQSFDDLKIGQLLFLKDDTSLKIAKIQTLGGEPYLNFEGYEDINLIQPLLKEELFVLQKDLVKPSKDEYFIKDLLYSKVLDSNKKEIGTLLEIQNFGASDIFVISKDKNTILVPFIEGLVEDINLKEKIIVLDTKTLEEIKV